MLPASRRALETSSIIIFGWESDFLGTVGLEREYPQPLTVFSRDFVPILLFFLPMFGQHLDFVKEYLLEVGCGISI